MADTTTGPEATESTPTETPPVDAAPTPAPPNPTAAPADDAPETPETSDTPDSTLYTDPEMARAEVERSRREAAKHRVNAKTAAEDARKTLAADLIKFLDPSSEGEVTVEQVQQKLVESGARGDVAERRLAILEAAWVAGIDRTKLGYLEFELGRDTNLASVSHSADDFSDTLAAAIQARVSADPSLKTPGAVTTTGAEKFAGSDTESVVTKERFASMSLQERQKLYLEDRATYDRLVNS